MASETATSTIRNAASTPEIVSWPRSAERLWKPMLPGTRSRSPGTTAIAVRARDDPVVGVAESGHRHGPQERPELGRRGARSPRAAPGTRQRTPATIHGTSRLSARKRTAKATGATTSATHSVHTGSGAGMTAATLPKSRSALRAPTAAPKRDGQERERRPREPGGARHEVAGGELDHGDGEREAGDEDDEATERREVRRERWEGPRGGRGREPGECCGGRLVDARCRRARASGRGAGRPIRRPMTRRGRDLAQPAAEEPAGRARGESARDHRGGRPVGSGRAHDRVDAGGAFGGAQRPGRPGRAPRRDERGGSGPPGRGPPGSGTSGGPGHRRTRRRAPWASRRTARAATAGGTPRARASSSRCAE